MSFLGGSVNFLGGSVSFSLEKRSQNKQPRGTAFCERFEALALNGLSLLMTGAGGQRVKEQQN